MNKSKKLFFKYARLLPGNISFEKLVARAGVSTIFPFYHVVSDNVLPHIQHLYAYPSVKKFRSDLDFILKYFEPLHPDELDAAKNNSSKKKFLLSFDDGLREMYDIVAPVLKEKGVPAIFFINSAFTDNKALFFRYKVSLLIDKNQHDPQFNKQLLQLTYTDDKQIDAYAKERGVDFGHFLKTMQPYLQTEQIKKMSADGFVFGAHSIDHPLYSALSAEEQLRQTTESIRFVADITGQKKNYFAFPFTADGVSSTFSEKIYSDTILPVEYLFGTAGLRENKSRLIERIPMEIGNYDAGWILRNEYRYFSFKKRYGR